MDYRFYGDPNQIPDPRNVNNPKILKQSIDPSILPKPQYENMMNSCYHVYDSKQYFIPNVRYPNFQWTYHFPYTQVKESTPNEYNITPHETLREIPYEENDIISLPNIDISSTSNPYSNMSMTMSQQCSPVPLTPQDPGPFIYGSRSYPFIWEHSAACSEEKVEGKRKAKKVRQARTIFTKSQLDRLTKTYETKSYLTAKERQELSKELNLSQTQIKTWFQNKRSKDKKGTSGDDAHSVSHSDVEPPTPPQQQQQKQTNEHQLFNFDPFRNLL